MGIPIRVLMVEDSKDDAALLLLLLRQAGYEVESERVESASSLEQALTKKWDIVISDHTMPNLSGSEALKIVRAQNVEMPFIFVSGPIGEEAAVEAMRVGAQDYVMKTNLNRLAPAVKRVLQEAEDRRERKRLEQHVHQLQRFEAIGRLAGGVAHDFNNIVGAILGWAELGCDEAQPQTRLHDRFRKIREQSLRAGKLTSQLLAFGRKQLLQTRKVNINVLVQQEMNLLRRVMGENIEILVHADAGLRVTMADPTQVDQVIMNLCLNARDAMRRGGELLIETKNVEIGDEYCSHHAYGKPGSYVLLSVSDNGIGMDAATVEHIFEPFFTTKELGKGTGLGLATVYGIVKQHGGFIYVYSEVGKGTTFRVYLKAHTGDHEQRETTHIERPLRGFETILLAEDHDGLRDTAQEMLQGLGYRVLVAPDGRKAVELFKANRDQIDLVVMDVVMPLVNGPEAYAEMCAIRPVVQVVFTTGYTPEAASLISLVEKGAAILQKPYSLVSLSQIIRGALEPKVRV
jgi:two-component system cell cycle sensor histidine kinase/response regulator CckA